MRRILIIDGHALLFRLYYATLRQGHPLKTSDGVVTNAIYGFVKILKKFLQTRMYYDIIIAWDKGSNTFRHKMNSEYKQNRKPTPPDLISQFTLAKEYLNTIGMRFWEDDDYEADDIIATIATQALTQNCYVDILTSDRDLLQLINPGINLLIPGRSLADLIRVNRDVCFYRYGVYPEQIIDWKAIAGDSSDNIKGIPGIGSKGACQLLAQYENLNVILNHISKLPQRYQKKFSDHKELVINTRKLIVLEKAVPSVNYQLQNLVINDYGQQNFFKKYEFYSLVQKTKQNKVF